MRALSVHALVLMVAALPSCRSKDASATDVLAVKQDNITPREERHLNVLKMREFLWTHWVQRRRATLLLTSVSKEGAIYRSDYEIIYLPANTLTLRVTFIHDRVGAFGKVIPRPLGEYEAYTVERVPSDDLTIVPESKITVLQNDAVVASEKYRLRFKGWGGEVVGYF